MLNRKEPTFVEVSAEYFLYLVDENKGKKFELPEGFETFARTCNRVVKWSLGPELAAQRRAKAILDAATEASETRGAIFEDEVKKRYSRERGDLFRHFDRMNILIQQLVTLSTVPTTILGALYCHIFEKSPNMVANLLKPKRTLLGCLPPHAWPEDPGVPPFVVAGGCLFSPRPIEGFRLYDGCAPERPHMFKFSVPQWFLDEGGWHGLRRFAFRRSKGAT